MSLPGRMVKEDKSTEVIRKTETTSPLFTGALYLFKKTERFSPTEPLKASLISLKSIGREERNKMPGIHKTDSISSSKGK